MTYVKKILIFAECYLFLSSAAAANLPDAVSKYRAGFNECANEVVRYLAESQAISDEARTRILSHLASILSPINALPLQQPHTPILPAPVQQQQQQQLHLSQLHLQQQKQNQNVFLTPSSQPAPVDTNNNKPKLPHPAFLAPTGNTLDINHVISGSPTAFQCPITAAVPAGLQVPCIAATAMATLTQLQLVPSALPSGQLALVLAPHPVPAMNLYPAQEGGRQQADHEAVFTQPHNLARFVECKPEQPLREGPVALVTKASRSHKQGVAPYQRPATPYQTKSSLSHQSTALSFTSSTQSSNPVLQQSEIATAFTEPKTITTVSDSSSSKASSGSFGTNIVRATSTWRPW